MTTITFDVGILLCKHIRYFLEQSIFEGRDIKFLESSGWFERTFTIKGNLEDMRYIKRSVNLWITENNIQRS